MTDRAFDPFIGESGLMDDVDLEFTNFRFGRNPKFVRTADDGTTSMPVLAMVTVVGGDEPKEEIYSIGNGWDTVDAAGTAVVKEDGKPHSFNGSTRFQQIITRCMELDEDAMRGRYESTGLTPQAAGFWEGFTAHWNLESQAITFGDRKGESKDVLMPTKILGFDGLSGNTTNGSASKPAAAKKAPAKKAAAKKAAAAKVVEEEVPAGGLSDDVTAAIRAIADECDTHDELVDRAYAEIDGIESDAEVQAAVEDSGPGSIWQAAVDAAS